MPTESSETLPVIDPKGKAGRKLLASLSKLRVPADDKLTDTVIRGYRVFGASDAQAADSAVVHAVSRGAVGWVLGLSEPYKIGMDINKLKLERWAVVHRC